MLIPSKISNRYRTIGMMTGTSMDGIDTALVDFYLNDGIITYNLVEYREYPFPEVLRKKILYMLMGELTMQEVSSVNTYIAEIYADAVLMLLKELNINSSEIDFIGCHGQTLWHQPSPFEFCEKHIRSTFQAIDASALAYKTNIPVISNFRSADIAAGGQGAPLVPIFDYYFLASDNHRALLNIGGMSNVTLLPPCCDRDNIRAFDTGPGNVMIDLAVQMLFNRQYDNSGKIAKSGKLIDKMLDELMQIPFISDLPPKSTGREYFSESYTRSIIYKYNAHNKEDIIRTFTVFTAKSIAHNIARFGSETKELICSGGGTKNPVLMESIAKFLPNCSVNSAEKYGLNSSAKEAIAFAFLAVLFATNKPGNVKSVTGAKEERVLGSLSY